MSINLKKILLKASNLALFFAKAFWNHIKKGVWFSSFIAVIVICVFLMIFVDKHLALYLKHNLHIYTEGFFKTITDFGLMGWWIGLASLGWLYYTAKAGISLSSEEFEQCMQKSRSFIFILASFAASAFTVTTLKVIIGRYRPRYLFSDDIYGFMPFNLDFGMNSFPSGHTISICTAMMAFYYVFPRYDFAYLIFALLISLSRVYTTVHYLSDVVMGVWLAVAITSCVKFIFEEHGQTVQIKCPRDKKLF